MKILIEKYDTQNQFAVLINSYKQIDKAWSGKIDMQEFSSKKISSVLVCGLGGSAISGDLLNDFLSDEIKIPIVINRGYSLPGFVDKNWLIIISSYSGNTEETISCFEQALRLKLNVIVVSSGGRVGEIAYQHSVPHIKLESGFQPRYALGQSFFTLLKIFQELKLIDEQDETVSLISGLWKRKGEEYTWQENAALEISKKLIGFIPVIYSAGRLSSVGYRFKCQLNENSKIHAFNHILPEMNHNEIIGWETQGEKQFSAKVIFLTDESYHPQVKKRFVVLSELIRSRDVDVIDLKSDQKNLKAGILDLVYLCDWISYYLAVLRGFDPSEIDFIHEMKKRLE